jgi:hypothetical protein
VTVLVAVVAKHDQVALALEPDPFVRAMMDLEPISGPAQSHICPAGRLEYTRSALSAAVR